MTSKDFTDTEIQEMSIYEKWHQIMIEVEYLNKDTNIAYGKQDYNAVSEEGVLKEIRPRLIKYRLVVIPEKVKVLPKIGVVSSVEVDYRIVNVDNPEEYILMSSAGEGADTQDKGIGKALTYSKKYLYLKGMDIITGNDPDKTSSKQIDDDLKKMKLKELQDKKKAEEEAKQKDTDLKRELYKKHFAILKDKEKATKATIEEFEEIKLEEHFKEEAKIG